MSHKVEIQNTNRRSAARRRNTATRVAMVGTGGMARYHLRFMLAQPWRTEVVALVEPSEIAYVAAAALFVERGIEPPPQVRNLEDLLDRRDDLAAEAAFIITPHVYHCQQAAICLEAGLDVLLEKPMVMSAAEALELMAVRDRSGSLLVVAFNGSLSPAIRHASRMLRSGDLGSLLSISATVWQNWMHGTAGTWRQDPALSGGGFLFDTGAHMLNTVADLAGEDFAEVSARLDNRGTPVDILGVVNARLVSGALVTLHGCGEGAPALGSDVRVFCAGGMLRTGVWGEFLELQRPGDVRMRRVRLPRSLGAWDQFLRVRSGAISNPSPAEVGLRMALLWDAIQESAQRGGQTVHVASA